MLYGIMFIGGTMESFSDYFMNKQYDRVKELGDKLAKINPLIDWEAFRLIVRGMYDNHSERGVRPY
jgi:IS5 family transposase